MKQLSYYFLVLLVFSSCSEDVLNQVPISTPTTETFYKTSNDMLNALNGVYNSLRSNAVGQTEFFYGDMTTDDAQAVPGYPAHADFDNFAINPSSTAPINDRWNDTYKGISRANILLERIENVPMDAPLKNRVIGETKFLRAYFYFNLVKVYGDVPLVLKELKTPTEAYEFRRESSKNVYTQIEKDLTEAITLLPVTYANADLGRITSGAAKGILARVMLFQRKFKEAGPLLLDIINKQSPGQYQLLNDYASVFQYNNGNNKEILFAIQYTPNAQAAGQGTPVTSTFGPIAGATVPLFGSNANQPTADLYNAFEAGDLRRDASIAFAVLQGPLAYVNKFINRSIQIRSEDGTDYPILRFADILLMYAECLNEEGSTELAIPYVNQVRQRAFGNSSMNLQSTNSSAAATYVADQAALRDRIIRERRLEFCFEGLRFFDLVRTNSLVSTLNSYFTKNDVKFNGRIIQIGENSKLFPIPQAQIDVNPGVITQNTGY